MAQALEIVPPDPLFDDLHGDALVEHLKQQAHAARIHYPHLLRWTPGQLRVESDHAHTAINVVAGYEIKQNANGSLYFAERPPPVFCHAMRGCSDLDYWETKLHHLNGVRVIDIQYNRTQTGQYLRGYLHLGTTVTPPEKEALEKGKLVLRAMFEHYEDESIRAAAARRQDQQPNPDDRKQQQQQKQQHQEQLERIMHAYDTRLDTAFLHVGSLLSHAVVYIQNYGPNGETRSGTGFLLAPLSPKQTAFRVLLMTNHHVMPVKPPGKAYVRLFFNEAHVVQSTDAMRTEELVKASQPIAFKPDLFFHTSDALDYTVVAIELPVSMKDLCSGPRALVQGFSINGPPTALPVGADLNVLDHRNFIIQYRGGEKVFASGSTVDFNTAMVNNQPNATELRNYVHIRDYQDQKNADDYSDNFLWYNTDTDPGASGSPVCDAQWQLIALHNTGVWARNPRNLSQHLNTAGQADSEIKHAWFIVNRGIRIGSIRTDLQQHLRDMWHSPRREIGYDYLKEVLTHDNADWEREMDGWDAEMKVNQ